MATDVFKSLICEDEGFSLVLSRQNGKFDKWPPHQFLCFFAFYSP